MPTEKPLEIHFNLRCFDPPRQVGPAELQRFAAEVGLNNVAAGRISSLLLAQMMAHTAIYGIEPERFTSEIKHLDGVPGFERSLTKPATPFLATGRLAGLQHKHFTASTVGIMATNIKAARPNRILRQIVEEELGQGVTTDAIQRLAERIVFDGYEQRADSGRLTGEWIVFSEHEGKNYYLCLASHTGGDSEVLNYLQTAVRPEFPFLVSKLPHIFVP